MVQEEISPPALAIITIKGIIPQLYKTPTQQLPSCATPTPNIPKHKYLWYAR